MSKLIVNKIDDILGAYPNSGYASTSIGSYTDTLSLSKNILNNLETNLQIAEESELISKMLKNNNHQRPDSKRQKEKYLPSENNNNTLYSNNSSNSAKNSFKSENIKPNIKKEKLSNIKSEKLEKNSKDDHNLKSVKNTKNKKDVFMTKVDIEDNLSSSDEDLKNLSDDDIFNSSNEDVKLNPEMKKDMQDFRNIMGEINDFKKNIKNEFDELQFLIKYVDGTSTRVNRHMNGISNLFSQSGLKSKGEKDLYKLKEDNDEYDEDDNNRGLYNKNKNMDRIKDNLINLQDNFIGYYKNFDDGMKKIETKNSKYKNMLLYDKKSEEI